MNEDHRGIWGGGKGPMPVKGSCLWSTSFRNHELDVQATRRNPESSRSRWPVISSSPQNLMRPGALGWQVALGIPNEWHPYRAFLTSVGWQESIRLTHIPPQKCVCVCEEPNAGHASGPVILADQFPGGWAGASTRSGAAQLGWTLLSTCTRVLFWGYAGYLPPPSLGSAFFRKPWPPPKPTPPAHLPWSSPLPPPSAEAQKMEATGP